MKIFCVKTINCVVTLNENAVENAASCICNVCASCYLLNEA